MSLINEALKEAQRERSERTGRRAAVAFAENFFPYPSTGDSRRSNLLLAGAGGAVVLVLAGFAFWQTVSYVRGRSKPPVQSVARVPHVVTPAPVVPTPTTKAADGAVKLQALPPAKSIPAPAAVSHFAPVPQTTAPLLPLARTPLRRAPVQQPSAAVAASAAPPPPVPSPSAQQQVVVSTPHVVVDPAGSRPGDVLFAQALAEQQRGNYDAATDLYEKALRQKPVSADLYNNYGALLASRGNQTAAISMYRLGLAADETNANLWVNLGDSYKAIGRHAEAMGQYAQAAKVDGGNIPVRIRLANEYAAIGDTSSARRAFDDAARMAPRDPDVHHAYGSYLQSVQDYRGAIREFQLFVDDASPKYPAETINGVKAYIATLRKFAP